MNPANLWKKSAESNFIKRIGGTMTPERFMDMLFHSVASPKYLSLRSSVVEFAKRGRKSITKQGLNSRFTKEAAAFVKLVLEEVIGSQVSIQTDTRFLKDFKRVLI